MRLTLTKHHGLGNDFLVARDPGGTHDWAAIARQVCHRRRGVGADGLLLASHDEHGRLRMVLYNADGSRAEMSGNGIRCFVQAVAGEGAERVDVVTDAGMRTVAVRTLAPGTIEASVAMGSVTTIAAPARWVELGTAPERPVAHVSLGNPHAVVAVDDVHVVDLGLIGGMVPDVNLEVIEAGPEPDAITMRVHERGAGITEACGTGACAAAWAARGFGLVASEVQEITVHMDGGDAKVRLGERPDDEVVLTGPATFVATVTLDVEDDA